ncbi:MAG: hypothetical protein EAX95_03760 [Candidatus Thorarchaeota archaeon]|nr:hypothetical protein [Candidatus Thorarchaeota archaeon]
MAVIASKTKRLIVDESKTVAELLVELDLTSDHVVLVDGRRMNLDDIIEENELVVVLPLIAGG